MNMNKKLLYLIIAGFTLIFYIPNISRLYFQKYKLTNTEQRYLIDTTVCSIPYLDVYNAEIMNLMTTPLNYECTERPPLVFSNLTHLSINSTVFNLYGIENYNQVNCSFKAFWRIDPIGNESDDAVKYSEPHYFNSSVRIDEEFIRVECKYKGEKYIDYHSFIPMKKTYFYSRRDPTDEKLNIIIIGTDSVSRLHLHRTMPKTVTYLLDELNAVEFLGYNKVADNTFPNLIPMLTGHSIDELKKICWFNQSMKFDQCSFIWQNYSKNGYITSFSEESSSYGIFNYKKTGWLKQPTDYYWKTFEYTAIEEIGHRYHRDYPICLGPRPTYQVLFDYQERILKTLKNHCFFTFSWITTLAHDSYAALMLAENDYINHLNFLKESGTLNNSVLLVVSDHGYRFGKIAQSYQGHFENRLPFLFIVLPSWFHNKYPIAVDNLKKNSLHLTTLYDVHATLNHILNPSELTDERLRGISVSNFRSISLFLPIPLERNCDSAGISLHWCTCKKSNPIDRSDSVVLHVAEYTVEYMNYLLRNYDNCALLSLDVITDAKLIKYDVKKSVRNYYSVSFKILPGGGWFDVTVGCNKCDKDFVISGTISRLNLYGNTSDCVNDVNLKLYCYCRYQ